MSTRNIHFYDKKRENFPKISLNMRFLKRPEEFQRVQKQVRINHGTSAIESWKFYVFY